MIERSLKYLHVLTIAGFDGSGGAGIQADLKTISALGCYATSVLTALPIQNTCGVKSIFSIPLEVVHAQLDTVLEDILPDAIKIGMVPTPELVTMIAKTLKHYPSIPIVLDPVMVSTSGFEMIRPATIEAMIEHLFPITTLVTPNINEAAILSGMTVDSVEHMALAGSRLMEIGCNALLLKGGHLKGNQLTSMYFNKEEDPTSYFSDKIETMNTHGTGCTLSSSIASFLARGETLKNAIFLANEYVYQAILSGADVRTGNGHGPLNHFFDPIATLKS
jgi:hydroxymethylpyrimidine/phosphomethylpyrimidine kinase